MSTQTKTRCDGCGGYKGLGAEGWEEYAALPLTIDPEQKAGDLCPDCIRRMNAKPNACPKCGNDLTLPGSVTAATDGWFAYGARLVDGKLLWGGEPELSHFQRFEGVCCAECGYDALGWSEDENEGQPGTAPVTLTRDEYKLLSGYAATAQEDLERYIESNPGDYNEGELAECRSEWAQLAAIYGRVSA